MFKNVKHFNIQQSILYQDIQQITPTYELTRTYNIYRHTFNISLFIDNNQFSYSYNPTFKFDISVGRLVTDNRPYVTGIGLYSDLGQLLVILKLTFPIKLKYPIIFSFKITADYIFYQSENIIKFQQYPLIRVVKTKVTTPTSYQQQSQIIGQFENEMYKPTSYYIQPQIIRQFENEMYKPTSYYIQSQIIRRFEIEMNLKEKYEQQCDMIYDSSNIQTTDDPQESDSYQE